jgi:hypothetical protein
VCPVFIWPFLCSQSLDTSFFFVYLKNNMSSIHTDISQVSFVCLIPFSYAGYPSFQKHWKVRLSRDSFALSPSTNSLKTSITTLHHWYDYYEDPFPPHKHRHTQSSFYLQSISH